ncbi:hypothetical protein MP638_005958 [Amoeboaphelidium occidentale]|nr:hypothetical protein MP638_005958 [Amoeboaphelidium occidentale]
MYAITLFPCQAEQEGDLSFQKGDTILNVKPVSPGWYSGTLKSNGISGLFPGNYVSFHDDVFEVPASVTEKPALPPRKQTVSSSQPSNVPWFMEQEQFDEYQRLFKDLDLDLDGFVTGKEVKPVFSESGLPKETLGQIWTLCDTDQDGKLNVNEFALGLWMISNRIVNGVGVPERLGQEHIQWLKAQASKKPNLPPRSSVLQPSNPVRREDSIDLLKFDALVVDEPPLPPRTTKPVINVMEEPPIPSQLTKPAVLLNQLEEIKSNTLRAKPPIPPRQLTGLFSNDSDSASQHSRENSETRPKPPLPKRNITPQSQTSTAPGTPPSIPRRNNFNIDDLGEPPLPPTSTKPRAGPSTMEMLKFSQTEEGSELVNTTREFAASDAGKKTGAFIWEHKDTIAKAAKSEQGQKAMGAAWNNRDKVSSAAVQGMKFASSSGK